LQSQDLARAFVQVLGNEKASKQVFNISGDKYVTFDGLAKACAKVMLPNEYLNGKENNNNNNPMIFLIWGKFCFH
jgi:nucleoside-diphosphate-sugar epimerase